MSDLYVYEPGGTGPNGFYVAHSWRPPTDAEVLAHPAAVTLAERLAPLEARIAELEAERDRLRLTLAVEQGREGPEGWTYSFRRGHWEGPGGAWVWRTNWVRRPDGSSYIAWGWEVRCDGETLTGYAPAALEAIEAANAASAGR